jgi:hypothetical protein
MIKDGLTEAGVKASVVAMPNGASVEDALKKMADTGAGRYVVIRVVESNWDLGGLSGMLSYKYDFAMHVGGPAGFKTQAKSFAANESNKASDKYNVFDMHAVRYREILETMFRDPEMQTALK